jgi:hypothetical protein
MGVLVVMGGGWRLISMEQRVQNVLNEAMLACCGRKMVENGDWIADCSTSKRTTLNKMLQVEFAMSAVVPALRGPAA